jgi:hypothetical protein
MHRQRSRFAARVNRVSTALERRGIAATYELHDRLGSNRRSRKRFAHEPPVLNPTQQRIVGELNDLGYAVVPFVELCGEDVWNRVAGHGQRFVETTEAGLEREAHGDDREWLRRRAGKEFLVRAYSFEDVTLGEDEAWLEACISPPLLDVASAYLRLWPKLSYVDLWYTVPQPGESERVASQTWHHDFDDRHLLKAFLYLRDVDEGSGPFEYVAGSQPGGRYHAVRPWKPMGYGRVPEEDVAREVPAEAVRTFTGPRGTLILCNTSGLHRGGFATERPRVLATATYCSPASLAALSERNFGFTGSLDALGPAERFALT